MYWNSTGTSHADLLADTASPDDPNEISFAKGEVLEILDKNGKWWQARKQDGTVGSEYRSMLYCTRPLTRATSCTIELPADCLKLSVKCSQAIFCVIL